MKIILKDNKDDNISEVELAPVPTVSEFTKQESEEDD